MYSTFNDSFLYTNGHCDTLEVDIISLFMIFLCTYIQVPLVIILKDETKYEDMVVIMQQLQEYVPSSTSCTKQVLPDSDGKTVDVIEDKFHTVLFGGVQLTVARGRGTRRIRTNSDRAKDGLKGLEPVCEDWHTKLCLLHVS